MSIQLLSNQGYREGHAKGGESVRASQGQDTAGCGNGRPLLSRLLGNVGRIGDRKEEIPSRDEQMGRGKTQLQA